MSRWLANVNSLLERLDGTVENVIEEQRDEEVEDLDSILAKRGLQDEEEEVVAFVMDDLPVPRAPRTDEKMMVEDVETQDLEIVDLEAQEQGIEQPVVGQTTEEHLVEEKTNVVENVEGMEMDSATSDSVKVVNEESVRDEGEFVENISGSETTQTTETSRARLVEDGFSEDIIPPVEIKNPKVSEEKDVPVSESGGIDPFTPKPSTKASNNAHETPMFFTPNQTAPKSALPSRSPASPGMSDRETRMALEKGKEALKEARTLKRHVVSLNSQLERAESEIEAQRAELLQAGERLEKDRKKFKEEKEKLTSKHTDEVKNLKKQHEQTLVDLKARHEEQIQQLHVQVRDAEEKRMQEGGDWTKELQSTIERERELVRKLAMAEDEKATMLSQISTLQSQQDRLQSRLDSINHTVDNAMMRERDAEEKLDMTLSLHARQISQRQAREAELERTIAELSATLAKSRSGFSERGDSEGDTAAGAGTNQLKSQVYSLEEELETVKTQLESERQRLLIMQTELRDMSKERTLEATSARAKQHQFDRQIADMSLQISKLQASLREAQKAASFSEDDSGLQNSSRHVKELTEQLVRQQEKLGQTTSELSALRKRLEVAISRAEKAEQALAEADSFDVESGPESGNYAGLQDGMRRRTKGGRQMEIGSIRAAINLQNVRDENTERIGKAIDALDQFSVQTGKYLRYNPLARGGFILYLMLLHLWTFAVLFLHTHKFETVHGDFGAGGNFAHGPHALMQQHDPEIFKQVIADKVNKAPDVKSDAFVSSIGTEKLTLNQTETVGDKVTDTQGETRFRA